MTSYRWINGWEASDEDWSRVGRVMAQRGWMQLNRHTSRILLAELGSDLVGLICLQMIPHTEPLWVSPLARGTDVADQLADRMQEFLEGIHARGYMVVAEHPSAAKMCRARGMHRVEAPVYVAMGGE